MSSSVELAPVFKDLSFKVQSSSLKDRRDVLQNITNVLDNPGVTEGVIKGLCKVYHVTLHRYVDNYSHHLLKKLLVSLVEKHPEWTIRQFVIVLEEIARHQQNVVVTQYISQACLQPFHWSCLLFQHAWKGKHQNILLEEMNKLVNAQSILLTIINSVENKTRSNKAYRLLAKSLVSEKTYSLYMDTMRGLDPSIPLLILGAQLSKCIEEDIFLQNMAVQLLDALVGCVVGAKRAPLPSLARACAPLLALVTAAQWRAQLLPALQKAMLRSPEVLLHCLGCVLQPLPFALCAYARDIGKSVIAQLNSKDDVTREKAAQVCSQLAAKIEDPAAIEALLKITFDLLNGSDGKVTLHTHKMSILEGAGNLSNNRCASVSGPAISKVALGHFYKALETETHEKTLCYTIEMMQLWNSEHNIDLVVNKFKATVNSSSKSITPLVRILHLRHLKSLSCHLSNAPQIAEVLRPLLSKLIETATAQQQQQVQATCITETLCAADLLITLAPSGGDEAPGASVWAWLADVDKAQSFAGEKYLTSAPPEDLELVTSVSTVLLLRYRSKCIANQSTSLIRAIVYCIALSQSNTVRNRCIDKLCELLRAFDSGSLLAQSILGQLLSTLENNTEYNYGHSLVNCLRKLVFTKELLVDAFFISHHGAVDRMHRNLWPTLCRRLDADPADVLRETPLSQRISADVIQHDGYALSACKVNAFATAVRLLPDATVPALVQRFRALLADEALLGVSRDDYFIFRTPEGEVYDKSAVPQPQAAAASASLAAMNVKRESKAYSYKEQLEELQLRRELDEKRRREGRLQLPAYTPKQLEAISNQLAKEKAIRDKLAQLNRSIERVCALVECAQLASPAHVARQHAQLLPALLDAAQRSPLAAPHVCPLYVRLGVRGHEARAFARWYTTSAEAIAYVTLRLCGVRDGDLPPRWCEERLVPTALERIVMEVAHKAVKMTKSGEGISESVPQPNNLTATAFAYFFPLLSRGLQHHQASDALTQIGLEIVSQQSKLRSTTHRDLYNPAHLPMKEMLQLLTTLIGTKSGRIQSQAIATLLDVASCAASRTDVTTAAMSCDLSVLLDGLQCANALVRDASLRALFLLRATFPPKPDVPNAKNVPKDMRAAFKLYESLARRIWVAQFDPHAENQVLARELWTESGLAFGVEDCPQLMHDIEQKVDVVQIAAAQAMEAVLRPHAQTDPELVNGMLKRLLSLYKERIKLIPAKVDEFGRELEPAVDRWAPRKGVALALTQLAPLLHLDVAGSLVEFFVSQALADREEGVRAEMLTAALRVVDLHGRQTVAALLPVFENFLDKSNKGANFDAVKLAVVILMGSLARHLERDDVRIKPIVGRLIAALSTPSQQVQEAVANCLPPLVPCVKEDAAGYVNKLLHQLLKSDRYGDRKGAAYGLAGMVKGMGILALKQLDIMAKLTDAIQNQKNYKHREGALFAFEMLFQTLGKLFEPYIVHVLPHLLNCFGDSNQYVRAATDDTARVVMSKLSGHGVKLVLPALLDALDDDSWRTKTGSVDMLGAMAFCAPKQLSSCLPSVVPKLIGVLSDSHPKVQLAGAEALRVIGSVIRNPEIQEIVPDLLNALQDPSARTSTSLQTLLNTKFVHFIDAPSLALIMPVVQRAFLDRSTETRKMAAQIIGNMYSLTDQKDLTPYLPTIIPGLKSSLLDPVPEVRSVSARALGAMVRGMGESSFEELLPWLMVTLTSESSSVNRSGAAQGLSEVVGGLGVEKLHKLMPEIISTSERNDIASHVKDGYIMMFIYMPVVFQEEFTPYIGQIIKPILSALADENEYVRDTALKAGQRIVNLYADSAIQLLLPELERGLFDDNWRIRYSSVQLLGDLLYRVSGVTGKMSTETASEDDNFGTEQSHKAIIGALGAERRNRVLAGLYMGRSDIALMVRQAALHVWKVVVTNTPRTLREILPTLFGLLLGCLASDSHDKRQVAARTLGDLVRKLGERVLPDIIPILEKGLQSSDADQRQGVCVGLSEIMASTSRDMVLAYAPSLVPTVRTALCDPLEEVRRAAAKTFDSLHSTIGAKALDDILPYMMARLNSEHGELAEYTLDGLQQVMAVKSRVVLPYLVPQLTSPPANTKALSILAGVAGESLNKYLPKILPALYASIAASKGQADEHEQLDYCSAVVLAVTDETGVRIVIDSLLEAARSPTQPAQRRASAALLTAFCANGRAPYAAHVTNLYRGLIHLCTDSDPDVLAMAAEALTAVTKQLEARALAAHVADVRSAIRYAMSSMGPMEGTTGPQVLLPGFCLPKGVASVLPTFREALLNGDGDEKEAAAVGLHEVIRITSAAALQPSVVRITGPLIRILGERFGPLVKCAVLDTLAELLAKVQATLKQFLPQLQTTFMKALADPHRGVRLRAAAALAQLLPIHQRPDPLFAELHNMIRGGGGAAADADVRETTLHALRGALAGAAGEKCSEPLRRLIHGTLLDLLGHAEDVTRLAAAGCLGAVLKWLPADLVEDTLLGHLLAECADVNTKHGRCVALSIALKESPSVVWSERFEHKVRSALLAALSSDKLPVALTGVRACGYMLRHLLTRPEAAVIPADLSTTFARSFNHPSNDVKQLAAKVCLHLARQMPDGKGIVSPEILKPLLPMLVNGTKEKNSYVKSNAEIALVAILQLNSGFGAAQYEHCLRILDVGARDALTDVVGRIQQRAAPLHDAHLRDDELDDTLLT